MFYFKTCQKCRGDIHIRYGEVYCFQCGRTYYPQEIVEASIKYSKIGTAPREEERTNWNRHLKREEKWIEGHKELVEMIKGESMVVKDIALKFGLSPRYVRLIKGRFSGD